MSGPSLLRDRGVRALVSAETISMAGSQMTYVVLPWFVLITTGSPAKMSVVVAAEMLPVALFGLASGAVTARIGARRHPGHDEAPVLGGELRRRLHARRDAPDVLGRSRAVPDQAV